MKDLAQDMEEFEERRLKEWVRRTRRQALLEPSDGSAWYVEIQQDKVNDQESGDRDVRWLGRSPADALAFAEAAGGYGRRDGIGVWTMEVFGDGENSPTMLRVVVHDDTEYYQEEGDG